MIGVLYYPLGSVCLSEGGALQPTKVAADRIADSIINGAEVITLPSVRDKQGHLLWEFVSCDNDEVQVDLKEDDQVYLTTDRKDSVLTIERADQDRVNEQLKGVFT